MLADIGRTRRKQVHWLDARSDELLASLRVLNGYDIDLAADQTRLASRLRDALTATAPALERAVGDRLHQAGVRDLLAAYPTLTALRAASQSRIERTVRASSPRIAAKVTTAIAAALAAQDVTVPAEAATGRVIAELGSRTPRARCGIRGVGDVAHPAPGTERSGRPAPVLPARFRPPSHLGPAAHIEAHGHTVGTYLRTCLAFAAADSNRSAARSARRPRSLACRASRCRC